MSGCFVKLFVDLIGSLGHQYVGLASARCVEGNMVPLTRSYAAMMGDIQSYTWQHSECLAKITIRQCKAFRFWDFAMKSLCSDPAGIAEVI
jgi:hypothetical protein